MNNKAIYNLVRSCLITTYIRLLIGWHPIQLNVQNWTMKYAINILKY